MVVSCRNVPAVPSMVSCTSFSMVMNTLQKVDIFKEVSFTMVENHLLLFLTGAIPIGCSLYP